MTAPLRDSDVNQRSRPELRIICCATTECPQDPGRCFKTCRSQDDDEGKSNSAVLEIMPRLFQVLNGGINPDYTMRSAAPIPRRNMS